MSPPEEGTGGAHRPPPPRTRGNLLFTNFFSPPAPPFFFFGCFYFSIFKGENNFSRWTGNSASGQSWKPCAEGTGSVVPPANRGGVKKDRTPPPKSETGPSRGCASRCRNPRGSRGTGHLNLSCTSGLELLRLIKDLMIIIFKDTSAEKRTRLEIIRFGGIIFVSLTGSGGGAVQGRLRARGQGGFPAELR